MTLSTAPSEIAELRQLVQLVRQGAEANERPDLVRRLTAAATAVSAPGTAEREAVAVATTVAQSLQSLEIDLRSRQAVLRDPGRGARLAAEAQHSETRLRRHTERAADWPRAFGDALAAASADAEFALQRNLRALIDEGTAMIETAGKSGVSAWLHERLIAEAAACHESLRSAADAAAGSIATSIGLTATVRPVELALTPPEQVVAELRRGPHGNGDRTPLPARLIGIIMPTYSGMMVSLVMPRLLGLKLPVWLIVILAVLGTLGMGGAAISGERQRQISRRKAEAAGELRSAVDALRMALTGQLRDGVRAAEQQLFPLLGEAVGRRARRLSDAAAASRRAVEDTGRTQNAVTAIESDLASIRELRLQALRLCRGVSDGGAAQLA